MTVTLHLECVTFLDQLARQQKMSRSAVLDALLKEHLRRWEEEKLACLAQEFFAEPETTEEREERRAWEKLSLEVLAHEDEP